MRVMKIRIAAALLLLTGAAAAQNPAVGWNPQAFVDADTVSVVGHYALNTDAVAFVELSIVSGTPGKNDYKQVYYESSQATLVKHVPYHFPFASIPQLGSRASGSRLIATVSIHGVKQDPIVVSSTINKSCPSTTGEKDAVAPRRGCRWIPAAGVASK